MPSAMSESLGGCGSCPCAPGKTNDAAMIAAATAPPEENRSHVERLRALVMNAVYSAPRTSPRLPVMSVIVAVETPSIGGNGVSRDRSDELPRTGLLVRNQILLPDSARFRSYVLSDRLTLVSSTRRTPCLDLRPHHVDLPNIPNPRNPKSLFNAPSPHSAPPYRPACGR